MSLENRRQDPARMLPPPKCEGAFRPDGRGTEGCVACGHHNRSLPVGGWRRADHVNDLAAKAYVASLLNRYLHLVPKGAEGSIELLKPSCMVQTKQPINRLALPVQASHKFSSGDILAREKSVKLDF
jgi:hypothetical protein